MGEELIRPIMFLSDGVCPRCMSTFNVFEAEIVEIQLDEDGSPINHDVKYSRTYGRCPNCDHNFKVSKEGMKYKIHSRLLDILNEEQLKYLENNNNPFGYNGG